MIGQTVSHYTISEELGSGGMGVVYRAWDANLKRDVAIKVLAPGAVTDDVAGARFRREALALSQLNHPNICTIHDVGEENGLVWLAMELVDGRALDDAVPPHGFDCQTAIRYGRQIADALAHAHEHGIVHRDLKSSNVMVTRDGRVKLLDFGLAKRMQAAESVETATQETVTDRGTVVGTLAYMAPETLRGQRADERSDIWALGVILHEMASGSRPFAGPSTFELSSAILREPPAELPQRVPAGLRTIVQKCLAKEPWDRYHSASEVGAALEAVASGTGPAVVGRSRRWWLAVPLAAALAVAALWLVPRVSRSRGSQAEVRSIAVLPFDNLSNDPDQQFFADGMTEQLITDLSKVRALRVISRTSVMQYRGSQKPVPAIARELGVDAVVRGSIIHSADKVRITSQLIRAREEQHLWADTYDRELSEVLDLQREVARTIANEVRITMTPVEQAQLAAGRRIDPQVHQLVLRGQYLANQGGDANLRRAVGMFEQAIARDPQYAPAHLGVAFANRHLMSAGYEAPRDVMPRAKAAAQEALRIDEHLAEAHVSLAHTLMFYDWDWPAAERHVRRAIELNPSSAEAHLVYGAYFNALGRSQDALKEIRMAQALDPLSLPVGLNLMFSFVSAKQFDEAIAEGEKIAQRAPDFPWAYVVAALAHGEKGEFDEALAKLEKLKGDHPTFTALAAHVQAAKGNRREAERLIASLKRFAGKRYVCAYEVAHAYVKLGNKERAFEWLEKGRRDRADCMIWLMAEPWMAALQGDARYDRLIADMGLKSGTRGVAP